MSADRQRLIESLYHAALAHAPEARSTFFAEACGSDAALRREVESLLGYAAADSFLEQPALQPVPRLAAGHTLGHYTVVGPLGKGGMGEVYRAKDTRLPREVAVKVLPALFAADPDRLKRLEREAQAVSSLNHPHICTLHDIGHHEGLDFLVMELVEGRPLSERLAKGPLPVTEALARGIEIADALSTAHRRGIVHRDLKPGNVMLTKSGAKLLDFGLARFVARAGAAPVGPTDTSITERGAIVGTVQYMAPEQLEGREADARTDIFAFGAVLYEMVTGRKAFEAANDASLISAILRDQPVPMSVRQPLTPPALDRIVRTCLEKDPDNRWQSAGDLARELRWVAGEIAATQASATTAPRSAAFRADVPHARRLSWLGLGIAAGAALTALAIWAMRVPSQKPPGPSRHLQVGLAPADALRGFRPDELTAGAGRPSSRVLALSPDGGTLVFAGVRNDVQQLFRRDLNRDDAMPITGTQDATQPFFSPDGRRLGFWQAVHEGRGEGRLRWIPLDGGLVGDLCKVDVVVGATWGDDGAIVFGTNDGLKRVPADGGQPQEIALVQGKPAPNPAGRRSFLYPQMLPGAAAVLYTFPQSAAFGFNYDMAVAVLSLRDGTSRVLIEDASDARYVPEIGQIVYARSGKLMAAAFDIVELRVTAREVGLVDSVLHELYGRNTYYRSGVAQYAVSRLGTFAYVAGGIHRDATNSVIWFEPATGRSEPVGLPKGAYRAVRLSPDGRQLVTATTGQDSGVWIYDLDRRQQQRLPFAGRAEFARWTPDGQRVVFTGYGKNVPVEIFSIPVDGHAPAEALTASVKGKGSPIVDTWTPTGDLIFVGSTPTTNNDIWLFDMKTRTGKPLLNSSWDETNAALSPDGRWLAYATREFGRIGEQYDLYVTPYPALDRRVLVSTSGGRLPRWVRNGRELLYVETEDGADALRLMSVDVRTAPAFGASAPRVVWEGPAARLGGFDVTPDGRRLLAVTQEDPTPPAPRIINIVENWFDELRAKSVAPGQR